jgi:hypothetical protein
MVLGGFLLMCGMFVLFLSTYGALHDGSNPPQHLMNKGLTGGPILIYFGVWLMIPSSADYPSDHDLTRWQWMRRHWLLCLGCFAFDALVIACWVSYLHHHGFPHVS